MRMGTTALAAMLLCASAVATACSGGDDDSFEPTGSVGSSSGPDSGADETVVRVDTGQWGNDAMMPTLVEYLDARQTSMRERRITPAMVETATFQWIQQQRAVIADAEQRGWTVPAQARMRIAGVESDGADAVVRVCMWAPSVDFVDAKTGKPVEPEVRQWYPFDVKMVLADDRWYVAAAAEGDFGCEVDDG
jgi:hypothetical protein